MNWRKGSKHSVIVPKADNGATKMAFGNVLDSLPSLIVASLLYLHYCFLFFLFRCLMSDDTALKDRPYGQKYSSECIKLALPHKETLAKFSSVLLKHPSSK